MRGRSMDVAFKVLAGILMVTGIAITYAAGFFVKRYNLTEKIGIPEALELSEKEEEKYKRDNAVLKVKMIGAGICLPGALLLFVLFR